MTDTTVEQMKKHIARKEKLVAKHRDELFNLKAELRRVCPHTNQKVNEWYFDGSYLNKAYTERTIKCVDCGVELGQETETHSYYG